MNCVRVKLHGAVPHWSPKMTDLTAVRSLFWKMKCLLGLMEVVAVGSRWPPISALSPCCHLFGTRMSTVFDRSQLFGLRSCRLTQTHTYKHKLSRSPAVLSHICTQMQFVYTIQTNRANVSLAAHTITEKRSSCWHSGWSTQRESKKIKNRDQRKSY